MKKLNKAEKFDLNKDGKFDIRDIIVFALKFFLKKFSFLLLFYIYSQKWSGHSCSPTIYVANIRNAYERYSFS